MNSQYGRVERALIRHATGPEPYVPGRCGARTMGLGSLGAIVGRVAGGVVGLVAVEGVPKSPQCVAGRFGGGVGVDLHRYRDAAMAEDLHCHAWVYFECG
jgi:hypothetical protein